MNALLLIDIQNDFLPGGALAVPEGDHILPIVNRILSFPFDIIVASQDFHPSDHCSFANVHGKQSGDVVVIEKIEQVLWPVHCVQGTKGADFAPGWDAKKVQRVFQKGIDRNIDSYSAFFDNGHLRSTGLAEFLVKKGVETIFIAGLATDYCVKFSALDAIQEHFKVYLIVDACKGVNLHVGDVEKSLEELQAAGVKLISSDQLCNEDRGGGI